MLVAESTEGAGEVAGFDRGALASGEQVAGADPGHALVSAQLDLASTFDT